MALGSGVNWEIRTTGSDTNGGGFDSAGTGITRATDLIATSGTTTAPQVTSASYTFVAEDVGAWVFVRQGTGWTPGFYKITSVSAGAATLNATIGEAVLYPTDTVLVPSTVAGCATVSTTTNDATVRWSIDYSQQAAARASGTNLTVNGTTNTDVLPDGHTPSVADVGNIIYISAGAGFTTGHYQIMSIQSGMWRLDRSPAAVSTAGGSWALGGALASLGMSGLSVIAGHACWVQSGSYSVTSATVNISGGCFSAGNIAHSIIGYSTIRSDECVNGTRPILTATGSISTFTMITTGSGAACFRSLELDGSLYTSSRGMSVNRGYVGNCVFRRFTNIALTFVTNGTVVDCYATGCTTTGPAMGVVVGIMVRCVSVGNSVSGFSSGNGCIYVNCISAFNTGASSDGFGMVSTGSQSFGCIAYGNGRHGFYLAQIDCGLTDCIAVNNGGWGVTDASLRASNYAHRVATYNNTSGSISNIYTRRGNITLTGDPFVGAAYYNFALNDVAGAGAACRQLMTAFLNIPTIAYPAVGATQPYSPTNAEIAEAVWVHSSRTLT